MSTNIIKINRGDSFEFTIPIFDSNDYTKKHLLTANEVVYFALLYPNSSFEDAFLMRGFDSQDQNIADGSIKIKITPNDTRSLKSGVYYYTVKLQRGGTPGVINDLDEPEEVRTIIERTKFIINE